LFGRFVRIGERCPLSRYVETVGGQYDSGIPFNFAPAVDGTKNAAAVRAAAFLTI
jgi:hypothetical protein